MTPNRPFATGAVCPGYVQGGSQPTPSSVALRDGRVAHLDDDGNVIGYLDTLESVDGWTFMAIIDDDEGHPLAVLEQLTEQSGSIAFLSERGVVSLLSKTLEPTAADSQPSWYRGYEKSQVLPGQPDVMREELLAGGDDPGTAAVLACYPPVRKAFFEGHDRPHTFVGTGLSNDVIPLYYDDVTMVSRVPIGVIAPGSEQAMRDERLWEGLIGDWYPFVRTVYPTSQDASWEVVTFARIDGADEHLQPVWYRAVRLEAGQVRSVRYIDSFLPYPSEGEYLAARFYRSLLATSRYWDRELAGGMAVRTPDRWFDSRVRHALARELITRRGNHPKYGIADQAYAGAEHDGFQDVLVSSVIAFLEWNYPERAVGYLDNYFDRFVRPDGTIHYRGPEIGKYGVTLTCLAMYYDYTQDAQPLLRHATKIDAMVKLLLERWRHARELDPDDPAFGMIPGYHEADINFLTPNVYELDYDRPYLSNTGAIWRGIRDLGRVWRAIGDESGRADLVEKGSALLNDAELMLENSRCGIARSWLEKNGEVGLPIIAGDTSFYWEYPYRARPESYDENRVWSELYFSGAATEETVRAIWEAAGARGHTTLGVFNNRVSMVGFLVWEEIFGLLQHDLIPEALLVFYAQAFHAHSRGTWTAIECVDLDRDRGAHSPYCLPSQMTVPIAAKWFLVFEDPLDGTIVLGRALPRRWLAHGEEVVVEAAPTRRGAVGFRLHSRLNDGLIDAQVTLPQRPGAPLHLRLRAPLGYRLAGVDVTSPNAPEVRIDGDEIIFPALSTGEVELITRWTHADA